MSDNEQTSELTNETYEDTEKVQNVESLEKMFEVKSEVETDEASNVELSEGKCEETSEEIKEGSVEEKEEKEKVNPEGDIKETVDNAWGIPVCMLEDMITDEQINYMNSEEATLHELGEIMEIIRNKNLKRLAFGCRCAPGLLRTDINSLSKARKVESEVIFTSYVLERICIVIGSRVKRTLEELFIQSLPISFWIPLLRINRTRCLKKLSLRFCRLSDYGSKCLFHNMSPTLTHLDLTGNNITSKGVIFIEEAIKEQNARTSTKSSVRGLQYLCLNGNPLESEGLSIIVHVLMSDFSLKCVELRNCNIKEVGDAIALATVNTGLEVFDLRSNPISDRRSLDEIIALIKNNNPPETAIFQWANISTKFV